MRVTRLLCAAVAFATLLGGGLAHAGWDPPGWRPQPAKTALEPTSPVVLPLLWAMRAYRATVSRVDGDRCPSYPSCSAYALEAVQRHGPLLGLTLTAGRLVAEADEAAFAPRIHIGGRWKVYAPVEDDLAFLQGRLDP
jgi:hypothetical protein